MEPPCAPGRLDSLSPLLCLGGLVCAALTACGGADPAREQPRSLPPPVAPQLTAGCTLSLDSATGEVRFRGARLADVEPSTLRELAGEPDRVETTQSRERYEEHGWNGEQGTSIMVTVEIHSTVYDTLSIAIETAQPRATNPLTGPSFLRLFFEHPRQLTNRRAPPELPRARGGCALELDGEALDTTRGLVPAGTDHVAGQVPLLGATFGVTSYTGIVDSLYLDSPSFRLTIFLDAAATQRAAYAEIRMRRP